jgi:aspartyl-tRNA(Asn)/glutamyl-tRNA(Gln) amidotransferase subunit C
MLASDMPTALTRDDAARIAALAMLELSDDELDLLARQLGDILAYADQVQQIDTTGVPPTASVVTRHAADRADELRPCLDREDALANAPDPALDAGLFKVPRVIG